MLGERLEKARVAKGMSQNELAKELGITQAAYWYFENNEKSPSLPVAKRLATILGVSLDYLAGLEKE